MDTLIGQVSASSLGPTSACSSFLASFSHIAHDADLIDSAMMPYEIRMSGGPSTFTWSISDPYLIGRDPPPLDAGHYDDSWLLVAWCRLVDWNGA